MTEPLPLESEDTQGDLTARVYEHARTLSLRERNAFLEEVCRGNEELRSELDSLLEHAEAGEHFIERLGEIVTSSTLAPSFKIAHYEILSCIGVGGMGAVYRARDTRLQRDVALKFLPAHLRASPNAGEQQLLAEARIAAALEHVNVCTVHEIGETDRGQPFIAMTFYEGETLRERLSHGPLPLQDVIDIARQTARGLSVAHARGIIHRDVKPGNVMLTMDRTVKLLDFGLAEVIDSSEAIPGYAPGTIAYMSPEQTRGDAVTVQSDLWSLGVVVYEMVTGMQPFRGENQGAVREAILDQTPASLAASRAEAPERLQRIVDRLLEKKPEDRYSTAADLLRDLDLTASGILTTPGSRWVRHSPNKRRALLILVGSFAAVLAMAALWRATRDDGLASASRTGTMAVETPNGTLPQAEKTIAVLPFTNVSRDPEEDYLSDGLTEELIATLSKMSTMRVVARTSAFAFKDEKRDIREIGRVLSASRILEGSVQKVGEHIRVRAQLINAADGLPVWSETYDRRFVDVFAIQADLATRIATALQTELTTEDRNRLARRATASPGAFALYLKGRYFWHKRTRASYGRAIEHFKAAIEIDPQYAAPHAGLAAVYSQQGMSGDLSPAESQRLTKGSALRAIELDESLAEAHSVLGVYFHNHEWNMDAAQREHRRAVALEPGNPTVRNYYGNFLRSFGRLDEAVEQQSLAVELDPLAPAFSETLAFTLLRAGKLNEAYDRVQDALELDSTYWRAHAVLGNIYEAMARPDDAVRAFERANVLAGAPRTRSDIARVLARTGRETEARALVATLQAAAARNGAYDPAVASALLALGDRDAAQAWLEQGYRRRNPHLTAIGGDPRFLPFENDPRFKDLARRVGVRGPRGAQQE